MKLMDPGTVINPVVKTDTYGKELLKVKVSYEEEVGKDTGFIYVNPRSYRMEVYQFYHDESANDGEYIVLSDEEIQYKGMTFPQSKRWFTNKDDNYLGKDIIDDVNGM